MKFCTKCGNQMSEEMEFCQKCGTKSVSEESNSSLRDELQKDDFEILSQKEQVKKLRTSMLVWMTVFFVFAGIFAIGSTSDVSMLAGVFCFGLQGIMFLFLARTPKGSCKMFANAGIFRGTAGISKGIFVCVSVLLSVFLFVVIINVTTAGIEETPEKITENVIEEIKEEKKTEAKPTLNVPDEFASECPIELSGSMYDNIIGFPEISCKVKNKTDKEVAAVELYFSPKDVYGEEITGIFAQNRLQIDDSIAANGSATFSWQLLEQDVKSGEIYVYSVYFSDGTEWGDRTAATSEIKKFALKVQTSY